MFKDIERKYKQNLFEHNFNKFYWITALVLAFIFQKFQTQEYFVYISLTLCVVSYFYLNYTITMKNIKIKEKRNIILKIKLYVSVINKNKIKNLINLLRTYNFKTKNDLKLAIDYYNSEKPIKIASDYLSWIVTAALTLSSFLEVAYNTEMQAIDLTKIMVLASSTIGIIISILIPLLIIKTIINSIFISKNKISSNLSEDISYIYLNFDKYKNQLNKKS